MLSPDILCPFPEIFMWEPRICWGPYLSCRGDNHMGTLTYVRGDNYVLDPMYHVWAPTYYVGAQDIMWHSKYRLDFFCNHIHIWQVSLQLSCDVTFQMWTYAIAQMCHGNAANWGLDQMMRIFHLCSFIETSIEYMDRTIRDDTRNMPNMQLTTKKIEKKGSLGYPRYVIYKD